MGSSKDALLEALKSVDESDRCYALEDLEASGDPGVVPHIVNALQDPSVRVRETSVEILSRMGGVKVAEATADLLSSENVSLRNNAIEILEKLGEHAVAVLKKYIKSDSPDVRKFSVDILGKIFSIKPALLAEVRTEVTERLSDVDPNVAGAAAEVLGLAKDEQSYAYLLNHLFARSKSSWLQCNIIVALFRISKDRTMQELKNLDKSTLSREAQTYLEMGLSGEEL